jgi:hypothetical protein
VILCLLCHLISSSVCRHNQTASYNLPFSCCS